MSVYVVTGGTGFLGCHLSQLLAKNGNQVKLLARTPPTHELSKAKEGVSFKQGSITDKNCLLEVFEGSDGIFHLAGVVKHSRRKKVQDVIYETNVQGTLNVIEAAAAVGIKRVVYASTSGTVAVQNESGFFANDDSPYALAETEALPYYAAKIKAEEVAVKKAEELGVELICMRPTLLLGPGDYRLSSCRVIYDLIKRKIPFIPSGGLSFVDVRDAAEAFKAAMEIKDISDEYYLLASPDSNMSLREFFQKVEKFTKVKGPRIGLPNWLSWSLAYSLWRTKGLFGVWDSTLDPVVVEMSQKWWYIQTDNATLELNFRPRPGEETIRDTVEWIKQHLNELDK